jgi:hypothetical protein
MDERTELDGTPEGPTRTEASPEGMGHFWHKFLESPWEDKWYVLTGTLRFLLHSRNFDSHDPIVLDKRARTEQRKLTTERALA